MNWKIVADENIPFVRELFEVFGDVVLLKGRDITAADVKHADVLLVRSVTQVGESLLAQSQVKFVGTCTIGVDHLDIEWLEKNAITWSSAPGCNAMSVVQYVLACLARLGLLDSTLRVGILGCGNVGGSVYRTLKNVGMECVCVDPFKSSADIPDLSEFEALYTCDIVCMHAPLTRSGPHPSYHLINADNLSKFKKGALLINAGRGAVIDNLALLAFLEAGNALDVVLDVWEPEPDINVALLKQVKLGSPHIAGYSFEGKVNGSLMIYDALTAFASRDDVENDLAEGTLQAKRKTIMDRAFGEPEVQQSTDVSQAILQTYDPVVDDTLLREAVATLPESFDALRKHYRKRREPSHYVLRDAPSLNIQLAELMGFTTTSKAPA